MSLNLNPGLPGSEKYALSTGFGRFLNSYLVVASTWSHYTKANLGKPRTLQGSPGFPMPGRVPDGYEKEWGGDQGGEQRKAEHQHMWALEETIGHSSMSPVGRGLGRDTVSSTHTHFIGHTYTHMYSDHGTPTPKCTYPAVCGSCCTDTHSCTRMFHMPHIWFLGLLQARV